MAFYFKCALFPLGVLYLEHLQLAFAFVVIACLTRPSSGLQGPQCCGLDLLDNLFGVRPTALNKVCTVYTIYPLPLELELVTAQLTLVNLHCDYK